MTRFRSFARCGRWPSAIWAASPISDTALVTILRDAGFHEVRTRIVSFTIRFEDGASFMRLNSMALVGMSASAKAMHDEERKRVLEAITRESEPVLQSYSDGSGLALELSTNLATARG